MKAKPYNTFTLAKRLIALEAKRNLAALVEQQAFDAGQVTIAKLARRNEVLAYRHKAITDKYRALEATLRDATSYNEQLARGNVTVHPLARI